MFIPSEPAPPGLRAATCGRVQVDQFAMPECTRRNFALALCAAGVSLHESGCGTLLYPERRGQPKGQLDWGVVALDGLALLLFVVPGVIAFAVDFSTGAIYLPPCAPDGYSGGAPPLDRTLGKRRIPPDELTEERLTDVISEHVGQPVDLADCQRAPLRRIDDFWPMTERLIAEAAINPPRDTLRAQSPE
jgi:hypothetical protein